MTETCEDCGDPADIHYRNGSIKTATGWQPVRIWLCRWCAHRYEYERKDSQRDE